MVKSSSSSDSEPSRKIPKQSQYQSQKQSQIQSQTQSTQSQQAQSQTQKGKNKAVLRLRNASMKVIGMLFLVDLRWIKVPIIIVTRSGIGQNSGKPASRYRPTIGRNKIQPNTDI